MGSSGPITQTDREPAVGSQPVQSVAMAMMSEHNVINYSRDSMVTYRILSNHLSVELPMIRAEFAPWKARALVASTGMKESDVRAYREEATKLEAQFMSRKHAHSVRLHTKMIGGYPLRYQITVADADAKTNDPPILVYAEQYAEVLQIKHEAQKEATFESAVIYLFGLHLKAHNLLADAGIFDLSTQVSNTRGYGRSDMAAEYAETLTAKAKAKEADEGLSAFRRAVPEVVETRDIEEPDEYDTPDEP